MLADSVRRCLSVLPASLRRRWWLLVPLLAVAAFADLVAAAAIFVLFAAMAGSDGGRSGELLRTVSSALGTSPATAALAVVAGAIVARNAVAALAAVGRARVMAESIDAAFRRACSRILRAPFVWHARANSSELLTHVTSTIDVSYRVVLAAAVAVAADVLVTVAVGVALLLFAPLPALAAALVLGALLFLAGLATRGPMLRWGRQTHEARERVVAEMLTVTESIAEVKAFRREAHFLERAAAVHLRYVEAFRRHVAALPMPRLALESLFTLVAVGTLAALAGDAAALPKIAVFAYAGFRLVPSLNRIVYHLDEIRHGRAAVEHLTEGAVERIEPAKERVPGAELPPMRESLAARDVTFRYPGAESDTLRGVELTIRRGEAVGIAGETGAGKTTLLHLLAGLLEPSAGGVGVDGVPLARWIDAPRCRIALVPQRIAILDDTIRNNVTFGAPGGADPARLRAAFAAAQLDPLLERLPAGMETVAGERGARLSGGERQRIAIARALYAGAEVLLLDEPASALDEATEGRLAEAIAALKGTQTVVIASHRPEMLSRCDRVFALRDGQLSEVAAVPPPRSRESGS